MGNKFYNCEKTCQIKGLDEIYEKYFGHKTDGRYVEIGAFDGVMFSNTYHLAKLGWAGLLVEPTTRHYNECRINLIALNCRIEQYVIGSYNAENPVKIYIGNALSTTLPEMVKNFNEIEWAKNVGHSLDNYEEVPQITLDRLLEETGFGHIDILVVDVEGAELDVLKGFTIDEHRPIMCIIEAHEHHDDIVLRKNAKEINEYFSQAGYTKIYSDHINNIYIENGNV